MKTLLRPGALLAVLAAALLVLMGTTAFGLLRLGSGLLAAAVLVAGVLAVLVIAVAWSLARDAQEQIGDLLPPLPPELPVAPVARPAFKVREARPGEVPEPYLAAVRRGAQAREAAWKADTRHSDPHVN